MNEKLNIQDLIDLLAEKHGMSKKNADSFVKEFFQLIEEALEKDKYVKIKGLGTFKLIDVDSRESVNINTGERFEIQGHTKVSFTPEPTLKDLINKPFSHFETVVLNDETVLEDTAMGDNSEEEEKEENFVEPESSTVVVESQVVVQETAEVIEEKTENAEEELIETVEEQVIQTVEEVVEDIKEQPVSEEAPSVYQAESALSSEEEDLVPTYEVPEPPSPPVYKADNSTMKFFIGIVVLVVLLCVGAVTFMYYPDLLDRMSTPSKEKVADEKVERPAAPVVLTDSITRKDTATVVAKKDTVAEVVTPKVVEEPKPVVKQETPVVAPKKETKKTAATPFEPDSVNYKIVGTKTTYTIQEGETLTKVALRFYGTKALWPYIVKHNSGVIKNPDHVPYGTVIKIPELEKK